ncbi:hypothetical protein DICPUDRAFT_150904 [Dictyostelium purpureum]|uniref:Uncharacterized protein n=1 Tax=Dictyostelium purpureum TaxID=5786 RepID=F0ZHJ4_DICPU|nr:uncharacterized protein DICPUDRAFT_150904 [Dictyostelium purpureum]EGC36579.1 hypothetical protein DICPUDRAFT_150904 [Dictyostelium purpureum]|eukprot:XP_003286883.1 hypothetical protein DICPUDRAFT_150904 [Dictyostelium purpureum]
MYANHDKEGSSIGSYRGSLRFKWCVRSHASAKTMQIRGAFSEIRGYDKVRVLKSWNIEMLDKSMSSTVLRSRCWGKVCWGKVETTYLV